MSDQISGHLSALSRRDFLKLMLGAVVIIAGAAKTHRSLDALTPMSAPGYGSGRYGRGKYGLTSDRYSVFLPAIRK